MEENVNNQQKSNSSKAIIIVLVLIIVGLLGFVVYDKFIQKDTKPEPSIEEKECNCQKCGESGNNNSNLGEKISSVKKIEITETNQTFKIGNKEIKLRIGSVGENNNVLFVNDFGTKYNDFSPSPVDFISAYLTDKFVFFTTGGDIMEGAINYAIDENGYRIVTNYNGYYLTDFEVIDGYLRANDSSFCSDSKSEKCERKDFLIKYSDRTLIVVPFN